MMSYLYDHIVLIAENYSPGEYYTINSFECEYTTRKNLQQYFESIEKISNNITYYSSPSEFTSNIHKHINHIVFSPWLGMKSRNRKGFIPSICEANNIKYVGADAYAQLVCNDKYLSKKIAEEFSIISPECILYDEKRILPNLEYLSTLNYPVIVKPSLEGGSIGISDNSIVKDPNKAFMLAKQLYSNFKQPILIEEYIEGIEVSFCIIGNEKKIYFSESSSLLFNNDILPNGKIWGVESKKNENSDTIVTINECNLIDNDTYNQLIGLFKSLGKVDYMRIDGRIMEGKFHLIELSPDVHLGVDGTFYSTFSRCKNRPHHDMMELIFKCSLDSQKAK